MTKALCSDSHVGRYCSFSQHENELPLPTAFELRDDEEFLSANWIECFCMSNLTSGMKKVREEFKKHHGMTENGRFAVLNVGDARKTIYAEYDTALRIEDLQDENYPSHTSIWWPPDTLEIAITLSEMVKPHDMHPGVTEA